MKHIKLFENFSKKDPYIYDDKDFVDMIERTIEEDGSFVCTFVASAIKMLEGDNVKIYGFSTEENPDSAYFLATEGEDSAEGHHFAVLNDRYILDPWIYDNFYDYPKTFDRSVFDLQSKKDEDIIKFIYGDKNNWTDITKMIEEEYPFKKFFHKYKELLDYYNNLI